jgi:hypothetical protein
MKFKSNIMLFTTGRFETALKTFKSIDRYTSSRTKFSGMGDVYSKSLTTIAATLEDCVMRVSPQGFSSKDLSWSSDCWLTYIMVDIPSSSREDLPSCIDLCGIK